jgi:drug/metabolite transporter (DMT)-like permease
MRGSRDHARGTFFLTAIALVAFAANSVLCRLALGTRGIDAASFTLVRVVSGALALLLIRVATAPKSANPKRTGSWVAAALLFLYAAPFSFAYLKLSAGTGALILFACVQATMLIGALRSGERFRWPGALGLALALAGLTYLVSPGLSAPSPLGSTLMAIAGISWGSYSLCGRGSTDPLGDTANNFVRAVPFALLVSLAAVRGAHLSPRGVALALASGVLASGLGYTVWFAALRGLTAIRASVAQLIVPVLAAAGGALLLAEETSLRLIISAILILGGVVMASAGRPTRTKGSTTPDEPSVG